MMDFELMNRLYLEEDIMAKHLPQFRPHLYESTPYFKGYYKTTAGGNRYELKLVIPQWYPDSKPSLYVTNPVTLRKFRNRGNVNSEGVSHDFHTSGSGPGGCVAICHFDSDHWDASKTCVGVFMKGILWLEAYDSHLATGETIADILDEWKRRQ